MAYRSTAVQALPGHEPRPSKANTPNFIDFSIPIAHAESWTATSEDIIEASVAELMSKERRLCNVLHDALEACASGGVALPDALVESEQTFSQHWDALAALHPESVTPLGRGIHKFMARVMHEAHVLSGKLITKCTSYPSRLYALYVAASDVSIAYIGLQATALSLGDRCAAAVAARHLRHAGQLLMALHSLVPFEAARELQMMGFPVHTEDLWEVSGVPALPV